jgi:hypothetical protein
MVDPLDLEAAPFELRDEPLRPVRMLVENTDPQRLPLS